MTVRQSIRTALRVGYPIFFLLFFFVSGALHLVRFIIFTTLYFSYSHVYSPFLDTGNNAWKPQLTKVFAFIADPDELLSMANSGGSRLMPVLEDGLSSGHASENEEEDTGTEGKNLLKRKSRARKSISRKASVSRSSIPLQSRRTRIQSGNEKKIGKCVAIEARCC